MTLATNTLSVRLGASLAVNGATITFVRGRVTAIIGPNGAGKTSLIRALVGLVSSTGTVTLDSMPLGALSLNDRARRIGYLPQNGSPAWNVSVRELVGLGRIPHRGRFSASTTSDADAVDAAMAATDTLHLADRTIDTLSGGERARAKMARVLAGEPGWIIADEPLANLDPPHQRDLLRLLLAAATSGQGVVVVLHQLNAVARVADDVVMMKDGHIIAAGPTSDVLTPKALEAAFGMPFEIIAQGKQVAIMPAA